MGRGGAAAAPQDRRPLPGHFGNLRGEIGRIAIVKGAVVYHNGIACIGHQGQGDAAVLQPPRQLQHVPGAADAVEAHRVHRAARPHLPQQVGGETPLPAEAVWLDGEGDDDVALRGLGADILRRLSQARRGGIGLKEEVPGPQLQKAVRHPAVFLCRLIRRKRGHRADIREGKGVKGGGGLSGQLPARPDGPPGQLLIPLEGGAVQGEAIGLDGLGPGLQIFPVDVPDQLRLAQIGQLTAGAWAVVLLGKVGPHAAVKEQRPLLYGLPDVPHPSTSFAMSAEALASLA